MRYDLYILLFLFCLLSCSQKVNAPGHSLDTALIYQSTSADKKNYMSCNFFADETFRGFIYHSPLKENCAYIDITESPKKLLKNEDLFLQIYPFRSHKDEIDYGSSLSIYTVNKFNKQKVLMKSQVIDTYIVQVELKLEADQFFLDHLLEVCDLDKKWQGLQFVIYERREEEEDPAPIRITKFLIPPLLAHPEYFREQKGSALAAYHPFLDHIPEFKSNPNNYYELADKLCSPIN